MFVIMPLNTREAGEAETSCNPCNLTDVGSWALKIKLVRLIKELGSARYTQKRRRSIEATTDQTRSSAQALIIRGVLVFAKVFF